MALFHAHTHTHTHTHTPTHTMHTCRMQNPNLLWGCFMHTHTHTHTHTLPTVHILTPCAPGLCDTLVLTAVTGRPQHASLQVRIPPVPSLTVSVSVLVCVCVCVCERA